MAGSSNELFGFKSSATAAPTNLPYHNLRRQRAAQERLGLKSLRMRVIHYLVDRGNEGRVELDQPIIRWATELGASHEALYRTLAEMEREGVLQRKDKH